jgi:hypothetical protein
MIRWALDRWHAYQRRYDLMILWPACRDAAPDLDHARAAFAMHAYHDRAWLCLGDEEIARRIDRLE